MKKTIKSLLASMMIVPMLALGIGVLAPVVSSVGATSIQDGVNAAKGDTTTTCLFTNNTCSNGIFTTIVNILLFIIGAISVIMLIIGGIRYTVSGGASAEVTNAKNTILYAIVGLVVAFLAFAVVNWVLGSLTSSN